MLMRSLFPQDVYCAHSSDSYIFLVYKPPLSLPVSVTECNAKLGKREWVPVFYIHLSTVEISYRNVTVNSWRSSHCSPEAV
ncbi:hypothetical protein PHET_07420 [Paragonimus heterotremus]|uniref:Uncharacterized protein n=1 Tax=Paragonimus heterotremus TaxID=100268 RepID=A0A8J4SKT7_9TREM|nr:hypothetical protein PHET_07420 [Paragonimus heterotremus]